MPADTGLDQDTDKAIERYGQFLVRLQNDLNIAKQVLAKREHDQQVSQSLLTDLNEILQVCLATNFKYI